MTQMLAFKAETASISEIVTVAVAIAGSYGRKGLQPIGRNLLSILFDAVTSKKTTQNRIISSMIIIIVFVKFTQQFFRRVIPLKIFYCLFHSSQSAFSAGSTSGQCQHIHPADVLFLVKAVDVHIHCIFQ